MKGSQEGQCEGGEDGTLLLALKMGGLCVRNAVALAGKGKKTKRNAALLTGFTPVKILWISDC